jgi:DNA invertase Pin-like site-specific DNA recombinase
MAPIYYETMRGILKGGASMLVGYAPVSTTEQHLDLQRDALTQSGCGRVFTDTASGAKTEHPGLAAALNYTCEGDVLAVWKLDRLGRSLKDLLEIVTALEQRGIGFKSLQESMDTTTPGGKLIFHVFAALAEFERGVIRERTQAGLNAPRARGRNGGRPHKLSRKGVELGVTMLKDPNNRIDDICPTVGISHTTLYRYAKAAKGATT